MAKIVKKLDSSDPKFHYKMRALRLALGLTQEELSEMVGVSTACISMYERGLIVGEALKNNVNTCLLIIRDKLIEKYGYWYDVYLELKTNTNLLDIWLESEGHAPLEIIRKTKESAGAFMNV